MTKRDEKIMEIVDYLEKESDVAVNCLHDLDDYNGYLRDDRYYFMDELDEILYGMDTRDLLNRAFFGRDDDSRNEVSSFNPNRNYFYINAYGNLVSSDYIDYSDLIDSYLVEDLWIHREWIETINDDSTLRKLFDELETIIVEEVRNNESK